MCIKEDMPLLARHEGVWDGTYRHYDAAGKQVDEQGCTMVLYWQFVADLSLYLYEMIQLSDCGKKRLRTWQWIRDGEIEAWTAIDEKLVTRDWRRLETKLKKAA
ncbi:MAG: hypothetical protein ACK5SX_04200 [Sandaracinobacter sp.]